jgi:hypothetical protein
MGQQQFGTCCQGTRCENLEPQLEDLDLCAFEK